MERRDFLKTATLATGSLALSSKVFAGGFSKKLDYGIILSTLKKEVTEDPDGVMKQLAAAGYTYIEGLGRYGIPEETLAKAILGNGLIPIATGESMPQLMKEPEKFIELALKYKMKYVVCYWPWLDGAKNITVEQTTEAAKNLELIGKKCFDKGLKFAWHNHNMEFTELSNGIIPFQIIMENTTPEYVKSELDVYWVQYAGKSIVQTIKDYKGRIGILHLKDLKAGELKERTWPGNGVIDFKSILKLKEKAGIDYLIIENEVNEEGISCAVNGINFLNKL